MCSGPSVNINLNVSIYATVMVRPHDHPQKALNRRQAQTAVNPIFFDPANERLPRLRLGSALILSIFAGRRCRLLIWVRQLFAAWYSL